MIYKNFQDMKLSALGMGAMRLPVANGEDSRIDEKAARDGGIRHGTWNKLLRHSLGVP